MTSSVVGATNPNNTQQQGNYIIISHYYTLYLGALQNHPFYNPYIYTMYGPHLSMPGYSAQVCSCLSHLNVIIMTLDGS